MEKRDNCEEYETFQYCWEKKIMTLYIVEKLHILNV